MAAGDTSCNESPYEVSAAAADSGCTCAPAKITPWNLKSRPPRKEFDMKKLLSLAVLGTIAMFAAQREASAGCGGYGYSYGYRPAYVVVPQYRAPVWPQPTFLGTNIQHLPANPGNFAPLN